MFAGSPRLRDLLDVRSVIAIAAVAVAAVGLQIALLVGTVAAPLGEAVAAFDRAPHVEGTLDEALAAARGADVPARTAGWGSLPWKAPAIVAVEEYRALREDACPR